MVIEHIHNPVSALDKIYRWLKPGGRLAISVPNANSFDFKVFETCSYGIHIPNHLHHFTPKTVTELLTKCGFEDIQIKHQRTLGSAIPTIGNYFVSRGYNSWISKKLKNYSSSSIVLKAGLHPFAIFLSMIGQTGRMTVWAEKPL